MACEKIEFLNHVKNKKWFTEKKPTNQKTNQLKRNKKTFLLAYNKNLYGGLQ